MQLGNRTQLDREFNALIDSFDAAWMADRSNPWSRRARRAVHCAQRLADANGFQNYEAGCVNTIVFPGGRMTAPRVIHAGGQ